MPWRCPACQSEIKHHAFDASPRTGESYRCHVCRLDFHFNGATNHLEIVPFENDHEVKGPPPRARVTPNPLPTRARKKID